MADEKEILISILNVFVQPPSLLPSHESTLAVMKNGANIAMYSGHIQSEFYLPVYALGFVFGVITLVFIDINKQTQILVE